MRFVLLVSLVLGCNSSLECGEGTSEVDGECVANQTDPTATTTTEEVGNDVDLDSFPPVVVRTMPESGDLSVDPTTDRMEVEFSKAMADQAWSWVQVGLPLPDIAGVSYEGDYVNVAEGVVMEADTAYRIWINDPYGTYSAFQDRRGLSAVPYPLAFHTGDGSDSSVLSGLEAAVVGSVPAHGEDGVDPSLERIEVTFSKDMDPSAFGWLSDGDETALEIEEEGWDGDRTAWATVTLDPGTTYAVWINKNNRGDFADANGDLSAPWLLVFRTAVP